MHQSQSYGWQDEDRQGDEPWNAQKEWDESGSIRQRGASSSDPAASVGAEISAEIQNREEAEQQFLAQSREEQNRNSANPREVQPVLPKPPSDPAPANQPVDPTWRPPTSSASSSGTTPPQNAVQATSSGTTPPQDATQGDQERPEAPTEDHRPPKAPPKWMIDHIKAGGTWDQIQANPKGIEAIAKMLAEQKQ